MTYEKILNDIRQRKFSPLYFLTGEEPFFIDSLSSALEEGILEPSDREFNQMVVYGSDIDIPTLIDRARQYPMFSNYKVMIVREAQHLDELDGLASYVENPMMTTILVLCYKYKKLDKRKSLAKALQAKGVFFESKKLYDNQVPEWITQYMKSEGYQLDLRAAMVLADHVGSDLGRLVQEVKKLTINLPPGSVILPVHIEQFIGVSKEYNVFELQRAAGERNVFRTHQIAHYLAANPKENPIQKIIPVFYSFFSKLLVYHTLKDKSRSAVASALGINPFFVADYQKAALNFPSKKLAEVVSILRDYDLRSKGVNNVSTEDTELIREMLVKILL